MLVDYVGGHRKKKIYSVAGVSYHYMLQLAKDLNIKFYEVGDIVGTLKIRLANESFLCDDYGVLGNWTDYLDVSDDPFTNLTNARTLDNIRVGKPFTIESLPLAIKSSFHIVLNQRAIDALEFSSHQELYKEIKEIK